MTEQQYITNLKAIQSSINSKIDALLLEVNDVEFITNFEACEIMGVQPSTLSRMAREYQLKDFKKHGHKCYNKAKILRLKESIEISKKQFKNR